MRRMAFMQKATSLVLLLLFPCAVMASETGAMVFPSGNVSVNGSKALQPTAIFAGDRVQTGDKSGVVLTLAGSTVQVAAQSSMVFDKAGVGLGAGGATVSTTAGLQGKLRNLKLTPAGSGATKYSFGMRDNKIYIAALQGSVRINDGRQDMLLNPGKALMIPTSAEAAPEPQAGAGAGAAGASLSNAALIGITVATAALGTALGLGISGALSPSPASPSK